MHCLSLTTFALYSVIESTCRTLVFLLSLNILRSLAMATADNKGNQRRVCVLVLLILVVVVTNDSALMRMSSVGRPR